MAAYRPLLCAVLVIFSVAIYYGALSNGFVFDDQAQVMENPWITGPEHMGEIFFSSAWAYDEIHGETDLYRPMLHLVYMAEHALFGRDNPLWWHAFNIGLHALNSLWVFAVAGMALRRDSMAPFIAALFFAAHPVNAEVVSWVACVTELTFTFFLLAALYFHVRAGDNAVFRGASLLAFSLACLSKETAIVLPILLALFDLTATGERRLKLRAYVPYLVVAALYLTLRSLALGGGTARELYIKDPLLQLAAIFPLLAGYFQKLVLPINLSPSYPFEYAGSLFEPGVVVSFLIVLFLTIALWRLARKNPVLWFLSGVIVLPILPTFYQLFYDPDVYFVSMPSDRYLYLPSVGFAMLLSATISRISTQALKERAMATIMVVAIITTALYAWSSASRSAVWKDDLTLWTRAKADYPENYFPRYMLAEIYAESGALEKALDETLEVVRLRPELAAARHRLGLIYHSLGMVDKALAEFKEVLKTHPESRDAHYNVGLIYLWRGSALEAVPELEAAVAYSPSTAGANRARVALARAYMASGRTNDAEHALKETLRLDPDDAEAKALLKGLSGKDF
jgi:tetratricopeptide (TPR) repeat protein